MRRAIPVLLAVVVAASAALADEAPTKGATPLTRGEIEKLVECQIEEPRIVALVLVRGTRLEKGDLDALRPRVSARVLRAIAARGEGGVGPLSKGELDKLVTLGIPGELVAKLIEVRGSSLGARDVAALGTHVPAAVRAALEARVAAADHPAGADERIPVTRFTTRTETVLGKKVSIGLPDGWLFQARAFDAAGQTPASLLLAPPQTGEDEGAVLGVTLLPIRAEPASSRVQQALVTMLEKQGLTPARDASKQLEVGETYRAGFKALELAASGRDEKGRPVRAVASGFGDVPGWLVVTFERAQASSFERHHALARIAVQLLSIEGVHPKYDWAARRPLVLAAPPVPDCPLEGLYWRSYWGGHSIEVEAYAFTRDGFVHDGLPDAERPLDPVRVASARPATIGTYSSDAAGTVRLRFVDRQSPVELRRDAAGLVTSEKETLRPVEADAADLRLQGAFTASSYTSSVTPTFDGNGGQQTFSFSSRTTYVFTRDGHFELSGSAAAFFTRDYSPGQSGPFGERTFRGSNVSKDGKVRGTYAISRGRLVLTPASGQKSARWLLATPRENLKMVLIDGEPFLKD